MDIHVGIFHKSFCSTKAMYYLDNVIAFYLQIAYRLESTILREGTCDSFLIFLREDDLKSRYKVSIETLYMKTIFSYVFS